MDAGQRSRLGERDMSWAMVWRARVRMPEPMVLRKDTPVRRTIIEETLLRETSVGPSLSAKRSVLCWENI